MKIGSFKKCYLILVGLISIIGNAQQIKNENTENKISFGVHFPGIISSQGVFGDSFTGIVGVDARYTIFSNNKINFDGGVSVDYLKKKNDIFPKDVLLFNPNVGVEFNILNSNFRPFMNLGYGLCSFKTDYSSLNIYNPNDPVAQTGSFTSKFNGLTINSGLRYLITSSVFLNIDYKYFKINSKNDYFKSNIHFVNIGVGIKL